MPWQSRNKHLFLANQPHNALRFKNPLYCLLDTSKDNFLSLQVIFTDWLPGFSCVCNVISGNSTPEMCIPWQAGAFPALTTWNKARHTCSLDVPYLEWPGGRNRGHLFGRERGRAEQIHSRSVLPISTLKSRLGETRAVFMACDKRRHQQAALFVLIRYRSDCSI